MVASTRLEAQGLGGFRREVSHSMRNDLTITPAITDKSEAGRGEDVGKEASMDELGVEMGKE